MSQSTQLEDKPIPTGTPEDQGGVRVARRHRYVRHSWPVRTMHWINVLALVILLMSGLQIFNANPALYWGKSSYTGRPPLLHLYAEQAADGSSVGITQFLGRQFRTTGVLGLSKDPDGELGYKMAKYIMRIELVESFKHIGGGHGGYWEDQGYEWYAGT